MRESTRRGPGAGPPAAATLILACAAASAATINGTAVSVALPAVGDEFRLGPAALGWVVTAYFLVYGVAIPFYGRVADLRGLRRPFAVGLLLFAAGSVLCALAPDYGTLIGARILQAAGAAAVSGLAPAAISLAYPAAGRGNALGVLSAAVGTSAALGPALGGLVTDAVGWRYLFALTAAFGILVPFALRVLPRAGQEATGDRDARLDWPGGLLFGAAVGGALLALTEGSRLGWGSAAVLGYSGAAAVALAALVFRQRAARDPFVPRALLANGAYLALAAAALSMLGINITMEVALPQLLSEVEGLSPSTIGFVLLPGALALAVAGLLAGRAADRWGPAPPMRLGAAAVVASLVAFSGYGVGTGAWAAALVMVAVGVGSVLVKVPLTTGVSLVVGEKNLPSGLALSEMCYMLGVGVGTALFSAVLAARAGASASVNPLFVARAPVAGGGAIAYGDAFLALAAPLVAVLLVSLFLPRRPEA